MLKTDRIKFSILTAGILMPIFLFSLFPGQSFAQALDVTELQLRTETVRPDDPYFTTDKSALDKQWYLPRMRLPDAWEYTTGSPEVIVAIVDTGIHASHVEFSDDRIIEGYNSITKQGIDADSNSDDNGHGTSVAGVIGAVSDNKKGIAGISWKVKLMPIKALDSEGYGTSAAVSSGIIWATDHGANIINLSLGGTGFRGSTTLSNAITYAYNHGVLIVAAAGNDSEKQGVNLDSTPIYPICGDNGQNMVLGVAATDINDRKAAASDFGHSCIDISAPGQHILTASFLPKDPSNNILVYASGTSLAAPMVSGVAALIKAQNPNLSNVEIRNLLMKTADNIDNLNQNSCLGLSCNGFLGSGRINALAALTPHPLEEGNLVRQVSTGNIYLVQNRKKRLLSDFVFKQRAFDLANVISESNGNLSKLKSGSPVPPLDGTLIKASDSPLVYVISDDLKRPLTYPVFISRAYKFSKIVELSPKEVGGFDEGDWYWPADGTMVLESGNPLVYVMDNRVARPVSYFVFTQRRFSFAKVLMVSKEEFSHIPRPRDDFWLSPLEGTLVKSDSEEAIYLIQNNQKLLLSFDAFINRNYNLGNVKVLSQSEIDIIAPGEPIIN